MYIETRFYDDGYAEARLTNSRPATDVDDNTDLYDYYIDEVDDLVEWIEDNLEIELDDILGFVLDLDYGKWVDISNYC